MASQDMSNAREELELIWKFPGAAEGALEINKQMQLSLLKEEQQQQWEKQQHI